MSTIAAFSVTPLGGDSAGVSAQVAEAVRVVRASGLANETNAMFTNVEGSLDEVLDVVRACIEAVTAEGAPRVSVTVKIDHRPDAPMGRLQSKVTSLESKLRD